MAEVGSWEERLSSRRGAWGSPLPLCAAIALTFCVISGPVRAEAPKRVLFIASYGPTFPTVPHQLKGLREVILGAGHYLDVELMDSKRFNTKENLQNFRTSLAYKLEGQGRYDVVIAGDDNATRFAWQEQDGLLKGAPIIFFGVNDRGLARQLDEDPGLTGVVEAVSMRRTLELMARLHPEATRFVAISDRTPSGLADLDTFFAMEGAIPGKSLHALRLDQLTYAALGAALEGLESDSVVLLLAAYKDVAGRRMRFYESLRMIRTHLHRPLYHLWYHGLGQGVLGGVVVSHERQSREAASMALQILGGASPALVPALTESPNEVVIDFRELQRFGVPEGRVPEEAVVLHRPVTLYEQHAAWIWAAICTILTLTGLSLLLGFNIVRRHRAERGLRARERQLRRVLDASPIGVALLERGRIEYLNDHFVRTFGYALEAVPTLNDWWQRAVPDESLRRVASRMWSKAIDEARRDGRAIEIQEGEIQTEDGSSRIVRATTVAVDDRDLVLIDDVTEQRRIERRRIDQQKMEAIGTLAGGIAHDFNNILTPILGFVELSKEEVVDEDSELAFNLDQITTAATRAKELVRQILAFSRRSSGRRERASVAAVVKEAMVLMRASLPANITIETDLSTDAAVEVDVTQLHQVVMNLCANAGRAMGHDGGTLTVSLADCRDGKACCGLPRGDAPQDPVCLCVSDTGCGIAERDLARIFEPFFTTRLQGEGTGMGLAVVHGVVEQHGGTISVQSEVGRGTTFRIWLPTAAEEPARVPVESVEPSNCRKMRVLFVDDEEPLRALVSRAFRRTEIAVTCVEDGETALEALRDSQAFDALITDVMMPTMGGDTLVEQLRSAWPQLPVIMCTGRRETLSESWLAEFAPEAVLEKPIVPADLVRTLRKVLGE